MFRSISRLHGIHYLLSLIISKISPIALHNIGKYLAIKQAFYLTSLEQVQGDYIEFGVFTGSSLMCALNCANSHRLNANEMHFFGFDSFNGFGEISLDEKHPFYTDQNFSTNYRSVYARVRRSAGKLRDSVSLVPGFFVDTLKEGPSQYSLGKARVILIDNDTYSGALQSMHFCHSILQEGTIIILDDYFSYRGSKNKGVKGAFEAWKRMNPELQFRRVYNYGMGGVVYIVSSISSGHEIVSF